MILDTHAWIVGTALAIGAPLVTRDARILEKAGVLGLDVVEI